MLRGQAPSRAETGDDAILTGNRDHNGDHTDYSVAAWRQIDSARGKRIIVSSHAADTPKAGKATIIRAHCPDLQQLLTGMAWMS